MKLKDCYYFLFLFFGLFPPPPRSVIFALSMSLASLEGLASFHWSFLPFTFDCYCFFFGINWCNLSGLIPRWLKIVFGIDFVLTYFLSQASSPSGGHPLRFSRFKFTKSTCCERIFLQPSVKLDSFLGRAMPSSFHVALFQTDWNL